MSLTKPNANAAIRSPNGNLHPCSMWIHTPCDEINPDNRGLIDEIAHHQKEVAKTRNKSSNLDLSIDLITDYFNEVKNYCWNCFYKNLF